MYLNKYSFFCDNGLSFELKIIQIRIAFFLLLQEKHKESESERKKKHVHAMRISIYNFFFAQNRKIVHSFASFKMECFRERFTFFFTFFLPFLSFCLINNLNIGPTCSESIFLYLFNAPLLLMRP